MCTLFGWSKPTGPFAVGVTGWRLVDAGRIDAVSGGAREWMVQVWYPAELGSESKPLGGTVAFPEAGVWHPAPAGPLVMRQAPMASTLRQLLPRYGLPGVAFHQVTYLSTHAHPEAPVASAAGPCPMLLFSSGYFIETLTSSSALMEELASHGYVVASLSHPGEDIATVFPDGRVAGLELENAGEALGPEGPESLAQWKADAKFVLDEFERRGAPGSGDPLVGKVDLSRVGALGVAQGGTLAGELCRDDARVIAGASLDGPVAQLDTQPFLFVHSEERRGMNQAAIEQAREPVYQLNLRRARPLHLSGVSTWFPLLAQLADFESGSIYRYQKALSGTLRAFFDRHLRGKDVAVESAAGGYPEAEVVGSG
jgi:hypothetical protein